jgi:hypothetical protein
MALKNRKPEYIKMRCTIVNGESWDFLLDISPLAEEEVAPVIDCLVTGTLDEKFDTPKICEYMQSVMGGAAEALVHFCFEDGKYNHFYTIKLISDVMEAGLCCEACCVKEVTTPATVSFAALVPMVRALPLRTTSTSAFIVRYDPVA